MLCINSAVGLPLTNMELQSQCTQYRQNFGWLYSVALFVQVHYKHKADGLQAISLVLWVYLCEKGHRIKLSEYVPITLVKLLRTKLCWPFKRVSLPCNCSCILLNACRPFFPSPFSSFGFLFQRERGRRRRAHQMLCVRVLRWRRKREGSLVSHFRLTHEMWILPSFSHHSRSQWANYQSS